MPYLYGNHVLKAHLGRITEDTPEHQGVVIFSMSDVPLVRLAVALPLLSGDVTPGLWRNCTSDGRYPKIGPYSYHCVPPGGCRRIFA